MNRTVLTKQVGSMSLVISEAGEGYTIKVKQKWDSLPLLYTSPYPVRDIGEALQEFDRWIRGDEP